MLNLRKENNLVNQMTWVVALLVKVNLNCTQVDRENVELFLFPNSAMFFTWVYTSFTLLVLCLKLQ